MSQTTGALVDMVAAAAGPGAAPAYCRAVRLDRYGIVLLAGPSPDRARRVRLAFHEPVTDLTGLVRTLRPLLCACCRSQAHQVG